MRGSIFNLVGNLDTLLAVILGAILATGGSLLAEVLQDRRGKKHEERDTALRESAVYERNRERLFDIRDMELRMRIHAHVLAETIPIMAILEQSQQVLDLDQKLARKVATDLETASKKADLEKSRQVSLESVRSERANTEDLLDALSKIARVPIKSGFHATYSADGVTRWQRKE
jgi:hypothetical protein